MILGFRGILSWSVSLSLSIWSGDGVDVLSSDSGREARWDALERTRLRRWMKFSGRSFTMIMPSEEGPKASVSMSKETVPWLISGRS